MNLVTKLKSSVKELSSKATSYIYSDVECPIYLCHFSENEDDYEIIFDLAETLETMRNERLPKLSFTIWSGRTDINKQLMSERIIEAFTIAFEKEKSLQNSNDVLGLDRDKNIGYSVSSLVAILFVANPVIDLLLLAFALSNGKDAVVKQIKLLKEAASSVFNKEPLDQIVTRIQKDLYHHAHSFGLKPSSLKGIDYKHRLPDFIELN